MMFLKATNEIIELVSSSAADLDYSVHWVDVVVASGATPGSSEGKIVSATTTTITAAPAASTFRQIKTIIVKNIHGATSNTVSVQKDIAGTNYSLTGDVVLAPGQSLLYAEGIGWVKYTSDGVKINEAIVAQEAGDFATALTKVRSAKLLLVTIPTRSRQGGNRSRL